MPTVVTLSSGSVMLVAVVLVSLSLTSASSSSSSSVYGGRTRCLGEGGRDGLYYRDSRSFTMCSGGLSYVQPCAPGTRNYPPSRYRHGRAYASTGHFCSVNLVDYATSAPSTAYSYSPHRGGRLDEHELTTHRGRAAGYLGGYRDQLYVPASLPRARSHLDNVRTYYKAGNSIYGESAYGFHGMPARAYTPTASPPSSGYSYQHQQPTQTYTARPTASPPPHQQQQPAPSYTQGRSYGSLEDVSYEGSKYVKPHLAFVYNNKHHRGSSSGYSQPRPAPTSAAASYERYNARRYNEAERDVTMEAGSRYVKPHIAHMYNKKYPGSSSSASVQPADAQRYTQQHAMMQAAAASYTHAPPTAPTAASPSSYSAASQHSTGYNVATSGQQQALTAYTKPAASTAYQHTYSSNAAPQLSGRGYSAASTGQQRTHTAYAKPTASSTTVYQRPKGYGGGRYGNSVHRRPSPLATRGGTRYSGKPNRSRRQRNKPSTTIIHH